MFENTKFTNANKAQVLCNPKWLIFLCFQCYPIIITIPTTTIVAATVPTITLNITNILSTEKSVKLLLENVPYHMLSA